MSNAGRDAAPADVRVDGVLVIDKPSGITSHDVVTRARRNLGTRRVGHMGTLDPMATGVLPLVVGRATRLASLLSVGPKVYDATIQLGVVSDTYDVTGSVQPGPKDLAIHPVDLDAVEEACRAFTGRFKQHPPPFSAKKVRGVRAYRMARKQQPVELDPVDVTVHSFEIHGLDNDRLRCRVACSVGFYMRSLAHDIGRLLECGGCLERLRRVQSGTFTLDRAIDLDTLEKRGPECRTWLIPIEDVLPGLPGVVVTPHGSDRVSHGNVLMASDFSVVEGESIGRLTHPETPRVKVLDRHGSLLAIADVGPGDALHPRIVLV
jgi:tRNA pseudouridine55 synthase